MIVGFIGVGKLGLPVALAIESKGHAVIGYDVNPAVKTYVTERRIPYKEEGLQPLLDRTTLEIMDSVAEVVARADIIFLPVQTPHQPEYEGTTRLPESRADFDYRYLIQAISEVSEQARAQDRTVVLAVISTCLPGTFNEQLRHYLNDHVRYVYTPQFIAMGTVLEDYLNPEFNLIGVADNDTADLLEAFYKTINDAPCVRTDITTAEGIKVSYNTWITAKTVLANAWGEMSDRLGMNFDDLKRAWDLSTKRLISTRYTDAGMSDGGGCHPRDNIALSYIAEKSGMSHNIWEDLMRAREDYEGWHAEVAATISRENNLPLVVLGRSFKPETNIETGSPALLVSHILKARGVPHAAVEDYAFNEAAAVFIATKHRRYADIPFPHGSVIADPFGIIADQPGVVVYRLGRK